MAEITLEEASRKVRDLYQRGFAAMERGNLDYAIDMFLNTLELEPRLLIARKFLRAAEVRQAKEKKINHQMSGLKGLGIQMSLSGLIKKDPAKAMMQAEKLMRIDPLNQKFIGLLADASVAAELPEVAVQSLELAREHFPSDTDILERLGGMYSLIGQTGKSRECFESIMQLKPNDQVALKKFKDAAARDTMNVGRWEEEGDFRKSLKDEDQAAELEQKAKAKKSDSDIDALIEQTKAKVERDPDNINFYRHLAELYNTAEMYEEAIETLEMANERTGGTDPQVERALSITSLKIYEHNIKLLRAEGDEAGALEQEAAQHDFKMEDAKSRVAKYPNDLQFKFELGELLFNDEDFNGAIQQFQAAQRNPQRRLEALYYLGRCFKAKKQYDIAVEQIKTALEELQTMDDTKKAATYELGSLYEAMGDRPQALTHYKTIYAVDIGYRDVAEKIDQGYQENA